MKKKNKVNTSVIIALLAVLISGVSAIISYKETRISMDEKEAAVWPYMENSNTLMSINDSTYTILVQTHNKGVGPAILDSTYYFFNDQDVANWQFHKTIRAAYPNLKISNGGNADISNNVIAANEKNTVFNIIITNVGHYSNIDFNVEVNKIRSAISLRYRYSSIYGKCWQIRDQKISRDKDCMFWHQIQ